MDKSVDTFEENKHFLSVSFRNWKKTSFLSIANDSPSPPFQCWNTLRGHCHMVTTLKRGKGIEMWKLEMEKLMHSTKQVFFGECLNYFLSMIVAVLYIFSVTWQLHDSTSKQIT